MGRVIRCTYFLLAKGCVTRLTRLGSSPSQKSVLVGAGIGSGLIAVWEAGLLWPESAAGMEELEFDCWDRPGTASAADRSSATKMRFIRQPPPASTGMPELGFCGTHDCALTRTKLQGLQARHLLISAGTGRGGEYRFKRRRVRWRPVPNSPVPLSKLGATAG